ncbi:MAG: hypothetical protein DRJ15_07090 [Bacteroidetes bacterium]|nr:MAG: hypothetical protein DRJ15_07090 [Bacteroidota bacterium]
MNLRVAIYDTLVNNSLLVRVLDLDNEGGRGTIKVFVSGGQPAIEVEVEQMTLSPLDIFIPKTPITGEIHQVTAKLYARDLVQLHDTDTKMIKMGK